MLEFAKPKRIVSKRATDAAKGENCTLRFVGNCDPATVVACHAIGGGSMATKCPDFFIIFGCWRCHSILDGVTRNHGLTEPQLLRERLRALLETQKRLYELGILKLEGEE